MIDPVLGTLQPDPDLKGHWLGEVQFEGRSIPLRVSPDEGELEPALALARELVGTLATSAAKAKSVAADKLLEEYNEDWRMFQRARGDGSFEEVTNPALSPAEFCGFLRLDSVLVEGSCVDFCFNAQNLFAGHSIFVTAFDGIDFAHSDATLFG